ncbi:MAG: UDP-N-acetylglucosamine 2-epimerase (non-hydrolyzing) [Vicinamibacteria bacterium]|jgi:UDP-N-acetylglucosamine 2-epimerase (non-hydrolysing)|nr:UDP-N-acetylglucosamine 2-epimerase (non-hydrolyzing) [Vicinamibacteria bacterium]
MKVVTLLGTRPEIIRLSQIVQRLDACTNHTLVHTGQNHDAALSSSFFEELGLRAPDVQLGIDAATPAGRMGQVISRFDEVLERSTPDRVVILGDTDSGLGALPAARRGIPIYHLEAGNRCHDPRVPEELNRRLIDHASDVLLPYTERSRGNLLREGIPPARTFVVGNPIGEVLAAHEPAIATSTVHERLRLGPAQYFLATVHRAENVDPPERLRSLFAALDAVARRHAKPVVVGVHPRTADRLAHAGFAPDSSAVRLLPPFGLADFVRLEREALAVLSDSGTVQEECCLLHVPCVTLRDSTERPETLECGAGVLAGVEPDNVLRALATVLDSSRDWSPPPEYLRRDVAATVVKLVVGRSPARP